jgi:hypothetical protein
MYHLLDTVAIVFITELIILLGILQQKILVFMSMEMKVHHQLVHQFQLVYHLQFLLVPVFPLLRVLHPPQVSAPHLPSRHLSQFPLLQALVLVLVLQLVLVLLQQVVYYKKQEKHYYKKQGIISYLRMCHLKVPHGRHLLLQVQVFQLVFPQLKALVLRYQFQPHLVSVSLLQFQQVLAHHQAFLLQFQKALVLQ